MSQLGAAGSNGLRSYPTGLSIPESITMTFSFFRSDKLVHTNAWLRHISPCQPTQAMAGPVFSYLWNPHPTFPGRDHEFYSCLYSCPERGIRRFQVLDPFRPQAHQHFGAQGVILAPHQSLLCLVVDLFQWLQTQDIVIWARHIPGCLNVIGLVDRLSQLNQPIATE